jgi:branched-chain amino acid transport system permease protein
MRVHDLKPMVASRREHRAFTTALGSTELRIRNSGPLSWAAAVLVIGLIVGLSSSAYASYEWSYALIFAIFGLGSGISISWAGVPAFGQALFFAAGAYTTALVASHNLPFIVLLIFGAAVAAALAAAFGTFTIGLSFTAFAMLSLLLAEAGDQLVSGTDALGSETGLTAPNRPSILGISIAGNIAFFYYCLALLIVLLFACRMLYQSSAGRAIRAARDDAVKAQALGVNVRRSRLAAFVVGAAVCGVAGVLFTQLQGVVDPSVGDLDQSTAAVLIVLIGGLGTFSGGIVGGVIYGWLEQWVNNNTLAPDLWLGIIFIAVVLLTPVVVPAASRLTARLERRARGALAATDDGSPDDGPPGLAASEPDIPTKDGAL